MFHIINSKNDPNLIFIKDDPVRPYIPAEYRIGKHKEIFMLKNEDLPESVLCVSYQDFIPSNDFELHCNGSPTMAVFYTIWSYKPGSGRRLIFKAKDYIKEHRPYIQRFITLSPQTFTASRFHTNNGAKVLRVNEDSVNYEYT